jgi:hypothetical protein
MILTIEQLKRVAAAGGGFVLDASGFTFNQIRDISAAAAAGKARLTLRNLSGMTAGQLAELAAIAPGLLVFDLTG